VAAMFVNGSILVSGWSISKNILISNVAEKNILILVEEKKIKSDSEYLCIT
jgi:hypothetical protein